LAAELVVQQEREAQKEKNKKFGALRGSEWVKRGSRYRIVVSDLIR